ncbi:MAG: PEP-CTERM sorting domain-containing protein [Phycisphaeraceae bacterium]|nr:PEP-CTERM sorting domain-containing protein [Phycisphaeraceae bacterium]
MKSSRRNKLCATAAAATFLFALTPVHASYSTLLSPPPGEKSVAQILGETYGGTFSLQSGTHNYANGAGIVALRIDDKLAGANSTNLINLPTGIRDDQLWSDGIAVGSAQARFAGYQQSFGYFDGFSGGTYHNLFDVSGYGYSVTGSTTIDMGEALGYPAQWRWARSGDGGTWSSLNSDNACNTDHLITYMMTGITGSNYENKTTWMLFWEDLNLGDKDYNDLAVEIIASARQEVPFRPSQDNAVPEPTTAALGFLTLGGIGAAVLRRVRRTPAGLA